MPTAVEPAQRAKSRRERWEAVTTWPLIIASFVFLVLYSWIILQPRLYGALHGAFVVILFVIWAAFVADLIVRIVLTRHRSRWKFLRTHKVDVLSTLIPILRPFLLLRYLRHLRGFRGNSGDSFRSRLLFGAALYAATFIYVIALTELAVERNAPHATIVSFGDALWWSVVTIATVGYGDFAPVTVLGRLLAIVLMAGGVAIIGTASATIVSYLAEQVANAQRTASEHAEERAAKADE
jgi:voltage-gated potassium channel